MNINFNSDFLDIMYERGFIHQVTDKENLKKAIHKGCIAGYIGFDCTAPSLHVGIASPDNDATLVSKNRE
jgi:tyrosyl-tRNA synthetase